MKNIYCIVGPSGSGKTTIAKRLAFTNGMSAVESYTTRPPRYPNEEGHIFVSDEEFDALGEMCAYTEYNGYRYGVTPDIIEANDIYVIDPYGVKYLKEHYHGYKGVKAIRLVVEADICKQRMIERGDSNQYARSRLENDRKDFAIENEPAYDFYVRNINRESTINAILDFIYEQER